MKADSQAICVAVSTSIFSFNKAHDYNSLQQHNRKTEQFQIKIILFLYIIHIFYSSDFFKQRIYFVC